MPDPLASRVQEAKCQIKPLINPTGGDGFSYRQRVRTAVPEGYG